MYLIDTLYNSGGMEKCLTQKANILAGEYGYEVVIVTCHQKGRPLFYSLSRCVRHIDLDVNIHFPFAIWLYLKRLREIIRCELPDVVISLCGKELFVLDRLGDKSRKVAEFHFSYRSLQLRGKFLKLWMMRSAVRKLDRFVVLTAQDRKLWSRITGNVEQIYNFSPDSPDHPARLERKCCLCVGRMQKQKNHRDLIRAWRIVSSRHPDWELDLYGCGVLEGMTRHLVRRYSLSESVKIHKPVKDLDPVIDSSSIFVLTSRYEGFPMVLLEASTAGVPIVSYDCPCGPSEIIDDGRTGFIVAPGDREALADKICELIENEQMRRAFGKAAYARSRIFDRDDVMRRWDGLFRLLCK